MNKTKRSVRIISIICVVCMLFSVSAFAVAQPYGYNVKTYTVKGTNSYTVNFWDAVLTPGSDAGYAAMKCECGANPWTSGAVVSHTHGENSTRNITCLVYTSAWCITKASGTASFYTYS